MKRETAEPRMLPGGSAAPEGLGPVIRLALFRCRHPEIDIGQEFRAWHAVVPRGDGERVLARYSLTRLLDDLDMILAGGDPRARPG